MTRKMRVILMGGLGNQLFQYAFALSLSKQNNHEVIIDPNLAGIRLDESGLPEISKLELDRRITLAEKVSYPNFIKKLVGLGVRCNLKQGKLFIKLFLTPINLILEACLTLYFKEKVSIVFGRDIGFDERYIEKKYSLYLGYFQSYKFSSASNVRTGLKALRPRVESPVVASFTQRALEDHPLIVHVRLADYRSEPNFGIPSKDYFEKAITHQLQTSRYRKIWLFSDEPNEAIRYIPMKFQSFVENVSAQNLGTTETLEVMRLGRGYVIANSSFSWWGAYLSHYDDAQIIFPSPWFSGMPTPKYLCPPNWLPFTR